MSRDGSVVLRRSRRPSGGRKLRRIAAAAVVAAAAALAMTTLVLRARGETEVDLDEEDKGPVIGIDLGTTYSCVGVVENGEVTIIANDQGNRITPSYVAFSSNSNDRLIGDAAKNQAPMNPSNTVFDVKRFIGRRFDEPTVGKDRKMLPYAIIDKDNKPQVEVSVNGASRMYTPEEISAMVLTRLKKTAEDYLGKRVSRAVITVPAYFSDAQRSATKDAGVIAGLDVLRIINEPTAAALAYGLDKQGEKNILVFDLGGGTFDVTLLTIDNGVFEVLATSGDTHLGGEDFDQRLMEFFAKLFKRKYDKDAVKDKKAMGKLRREAEKAKRQLSTQTQVRIEIEALVDGQDLSETLTRARFEELNADLFKKTLKPVAKVLKDAGLSTKEVDEIVMVGGSTRIPKVQALVKEFFGGKELHLDINPDEAIAYGATVQAAVLSGDTSMRTPVLLDVTPLSMGIETIGGVMSVLVKRNTVIPTKRTQTYTTTSNNQHTLAVVVYEGERKLVKDCHLLGKFDLTGIPPAPKGVPEIEVTFEIDENGILTVTALEKSSQKKETITIEDSTGKLTEEQIKKMVTEADSFADEDAEVSKKLNAKTDLDNYLSGLRVQLASTYKDKLSRVDSRNIKEAVDEADSWLSGLNVEDVDIDDIKMHKREVEDVAGPVFTKLYAAGVDKEEL
ncbi:hypothetical protein BU14_0267s0009 [Porphyra umbilicalis]|uniref:Uncharacterized protein n=1 Tax=Porphyra umbilicalis TaxID=2786 RepID=A0A1X6P1S6_PORUM|nr:hypothetical protein BU14_0267s0009 [Porphyra umbilicalis]|eukprot:OSX74808.1 hypothetical protein BU14_0267s0009 [Porphyra umbilicalis]